MITIVYKTEEFNHDRYCVRLSCSSVLDRALSFAGSMGIFGLNVCVCTYVCLCSVVTRPGVGQYHQHTDEEHL